MRGCRRMTAVFVSVLMGTSMAGAALIASASSAGAAANGTITTIVGTGVSSSTGDSGPATAATVETPSAVAYDTAGNLYVADSSANVVRKVSLAGTITAFAGDGTFGSSGDGGQATSAQLASPAGVAVDAAGNVYIAEGMNIRKVDLAGVITTFAGNATQGYSGDAGPATAAQLDTPQGVAVDADGNVLIADTNNNVIRRVTSDGNIATIAGDHSPSFSGDGGAATAAQLDNPFSVALDAHQNILIGDTVNQRVRRVDATTGIITTIVGDGTAGSTGDGTAATLAEVSFPVGVVADAANNVFVAENGGNLVRKIDGASGTISTVVGDGTGTYGGDGGPATSAQIQHPLGIGFDRAFNLVIADQDNSRVRSVQGLGTPPPTPPPTPPASQGYLMAAADGGVFTHGNAKFFGSEGGIKLAQPIVTMASTPTGLGYWLFAGDGGVFTHGDAGFFGSEGALKLAKPIVAAASTPDGKGYWLFASDGGVFTHGDAKFFGSEGAIKLAKPIVAAASTPDGKGYWLFASDGGVFTHGDANFFGSEGALALAKPIVAAASTPTGKGYWLFASDGGVFTHGDAKFFGSEGALALAKPIVAAASTPTGKGYWLFASDGGVFTHGDAGFYGSQGATPLVQPIVAAAATPSPLT